MKVLLKFQLLAQDAAPAEQKNIRVQVDSSSTLNEVVSLGMRKAGFDSDKLEIVSAQLVSAKASQLTTVKLDEEPVDLGVYSLTLRERSENSSFDGEPSKDLSESDLRLQIRHQSARIAELENTVLQLSSLLAAANVTEKGMRLTKSS